MKETTVTCSLEVGCEPQAILDILKSVQRLPEWAPDFADRMICNPDGTWTAVKGDKKFIVRAVANDAATTVDYLQIQRSGRTAGAFVRVLPGPRAGAVIVMTLPVQPDSIVEDIRMALYRFRDDMTRRGFPRRQSGDS